MNLLAIIIFVLHAIAILIDFAVAHFGGVGINVLPRTGSVVAIYLACLESVTVRIKSLTFGMLTTKVA